ncbi:MAG: response regulator receiver modulated diguanylate cyclase [Deltaproteobacteria bacterium]|nr:response regulator receiver modulated diguanylate cyclase [Deltaproteobacteria bacterium]
MTEKILIVEDDAFFREIFSAILKEDGYQVDTASSGNEALAMLATNSYQLVVTDLMLQDISGLDILSRAKQMDSDIEVIVVTGYGNMESAIYALKNGARDYLVKPISHDEFKHVVRLTMEQRRMLDENQGLKEQIRLFQTSQTIANCIDIDRIQLLVLEATIKETGTERGFTCLHDAARKISLMETKGISREAAESINEALKLVYDWEQEFFTDPARVQITLPAESAEGKTELILLPITNKTALQGVVVLLGNGTTKPIPPLKLDNIRFLVEQSALAIENAGRFAMAKELLNIDELTGLYNYRYLEIALEREIRRSERYGLSLAVIFLDVDMLKVVNDTYGHLIGSRVLKEVGAVLKRSVREVDVVIRYGGDEYTMILIETGRQGAAIVAERIRKTLETHPFVLGENLEVKLTACLGFACYPEDTRSKLELLEMADRAMYHGKVSGRNIVSHISASIPEMP